MATAGDLLDPAARNVAGAQNRRLSRMDDARFAEVFARLEALHVRERELRSLGGAASGEDDLRRRGRSWRRSAPWSRPPTGPPHEANGPVPTERTP